jgi:tetratricopeptide (TPR) repeat protein
MSDDVDGEPAAPAPEAAPPPPDTAARYLARCLVADHGYVPGTFAEARPLAEACDLILTGGDGVGLAIACIVDRDADPARRFCLAPEDLDEAAAACRHHAGSMHGVKEAVAVEIWEVGAGVPDAADRARLEAYTFRPITQKGVQVKTYAVDTAAATRGDLVSTAADGLQREPWIRRVLREPRRSEAELAEAVRLRPGYGAAWSSLGGVLIGRGRGEEAVPALRTALRLDPGDFKAHNNLGIALAKGGRMAEALGHFEAAARLAPGAPGVRDNLRSARQALGAGKIMLDKAEPRE